MEFTFARRKITTEDKLIILFELIRRKTAKHSFNPRRHERGGGGRGHFESPLDFFGFKFLFLDQLPKALAQLFFVC